MFVRRFILPAMALSCAGCATLPEYREDPIETSEVILNIKCELREAAWAHPENSWVRDWNAALTVSLIIDHNGGVDADTSFLFPFVQASTFTAGVLGGFSGSANRTERIDFKENLTAIHEQPLPCGEQTADRYARLGGRLGIADLFARVGQSRDVAQIKPKELAYNLEFVIKGNLTLAPKFNLVPIGDAKTFTGTFRAIGSRNDTHNLKIVLQPPEPKAECPVELQFGKCPALVYLVNPDGSPAPASRESKTGSRPASRTYVPSGSVEDRLNAAKGRNVLQSIEDQLRQQNINP